MLKHFPGSRRHFFETKFLAVLSLGTSLKGFLQRTQDLSLVGTQYCKGKRVEVFSDQVEDMLTHPGLCFTARYRLGWRVM